MEQTKNFPSKKATFGIFRGRTDVSAAKAALTKRGFNNSAISVLYPTHAGAKDFSSQQKSCVATGAKLGAVIGGLIFLIVGWLVSVRAIPLLDLQTMTVMPNTLFFVISGLVGGTIFGGAAGALIGIGTPERAELRYGDYVDAGGILLSVHVNSAEEASAAQKTLEQTGAQDVNVLSESSVRLSKLTELKLKTI